MNPTDVASLVLLAFAASTTGPTWVAAVRRRRALAAVGAAPRATGRVHLVRPAAGREPHLAETLASLPRTSGTLRVSIVVADEADAAHGVAVGAVEALAARGVEARLVLSRAEGPNRKVQQLAAALRDERGGEVAVVADSDVDLEGHPLDELVAPLADPRVGAVWAPPHEVAPQTLADHASSAVLGGSAHAFGLLAHLDRSGLVGKLFAARVSTLLHEARLRDLSDYLGEDMELARRLAARGLGTRVALTGARSRAAGRGVRDVIERYGRWLLVLRAQRPALLASYPFVFFPALTVCVTALALGTPIALMAATVALGARVIVAAVARRATTGRASWGELVRDALLAELLLAAALVRALADRRVAWRAQHLSVGRDGRLSLAR